MKKAFIYVGHANWGKSRALREITNGNSQKKKIRINNKLVWVRKMSNDDAPIGLLTFVKEKVPKSKYNNFILTYCPNHEKDAKAMEIIDKLKSTCELFFFVQQQMYLKPENKIPDFEMHYLEKVGTVEVLEQHLKDTERAERFKRFIERNI